MPQALQGIRALLTRRLDRQRGQNLTDRGFNLQEGLVARHIAREGLNPLHQADNMSYGTQEGRHETLRLQVRVGDGQSGADH